MKLSRQGAIGALLDIYEQTIEDFINLIEEIPDEVLPIIIDPDTTDENCRSIQTILTHVVHAGYGYATNVYHQKGYSLERLDKTNHLSIKEYVEDLTNIFTYTETIFKELTDDELDQFDEALKIKTGWGKLYDVEQMMEHAIVHILRHKRQIEKIKRTKLK